MHTKNDCPSQSPTTIKVVTGSRLHFGLLDLTGRMRHADGGIGLYVSEPSIEVTVERSRRWTIDAPEALRIRIGSILALCCGRTSIPCARLTVTTNAEPHSGFGTGTQLSLAIATALLALKNGPELSLSNIASLVHRGGTSGVGVYCFAKGGFILDGGRLWTGNKPKIGPSSSFRLNSLPVLLSRYEFPDWGIVLVRPASDLRVSGVRERELFKALTPIPLREVERLCSHIMLQLLPALIDRDFRSFCQANEEIRKLGFKRREIDHAGPAVKKCIQTMARSGLQGISMSSWGPLLFGFSPNSKSAEIIADRLRAEVSISEVMTTSGRNRGAELLTY